MRVITGSARGRRLRELEEVMVRHVQEALDLRLAGVSALMGKVLSA